MIYHSILPSLTSEIPKHKMLDIYDIEPIEVVKLCNITKNIGSYMARYSINTYDPTNTFKNIKNALD
jgi:hypothetical protein